MSEGDATGRDRDPGPRSRASGRRPIAAVKRELSRALLLRPEVSGVGIEADPDGGERIKVYLAADTPELVRDVPDEAGGYPVVTEYVGGISPRSPGERNSARAVGDRDAPVTRDREPT